MTTLQFQFDENLEYQKEAVQAVVDLFEGTSRQTADFTLGAEFVANLPEGYLVDEEAIRDNLMLIQQRLPTYTRAKLPMLTNLEVEEGPVADWVGAHSHRYPHFTIEMETGTGKTYVYLRTIHELFKQYGFRKYIIVVPSIAIYEGVIQTFKDTQTHFRALYGNEVVNLVPYDGERLSGLRTYATSSFVEIMVMTLDSFNKKANKLFKPSEQLPGEFLPYQYIQKARPILILDEPQNMRSVKSKESLRSLHPLFALRYSATHVVTPNLVYQLTPFEAFRQGLVKRIRVHGVTTQDYLGRVGVTLIGLDRNPFRADVLACVLEGDKAVEKPFTLLKGDNLHQKTKHPEYQRLGRLKTIDVAEGYIEFESGDVYRMTDVLGETTRNDIFRVQIDQTIREHMQAQETLLPRGIKVLSLFFIDRVANYVSDEGLIRALFTEAYRRHQGDYAFFRDKPVERVHDGYFAKTTVKEKGKQAVEIAIDTEGRTEDERKAEKRAFELIMRNKKQLLSLDEDVSFIFAHSALKEGWDNPNVFQICTLNQTRSDDKKRQEIGRGLRIPVDQNGTRIFDEEVCVLTVVANESYERYVSLLQNNYREDGQAAPPPPSRAGSRKDEAIRNDGLFDHSEFKAFWEQLSRRTTFRIQIDTDALVEECAARFSKVQFPEPHVVISVGEFVQSRIEITLKRLIGPKARLAVQITDSNDQTVFREGDFAVGNDLSKILADPRLNGYVLERIEPGSDPHVSFGNSADVHVGEPYIADTETGQKPVKSIARVDDDPLPVFNLLERAAQATDLTRATILRIFKRLDESRQRLFLRNPEGFAAKFIREIDLQLSKHIADHIEFEVADGTINHSIDKLFPKTVRHPQSELIGGGANCVYDRVQTDSDVEQHFVEDRLRNMQRVVLYFKFPAKYRIPFPKSIGNYNPDWGVIWRDNDGRTMLRLIRETKGAEEVEALRFEHEKRKIEVARRHFAALGLDYRNITDKTGDWYDKGPDQFAFDSVAAEGS